MRDAITTLLELAGGLLLAAAAAGAVATVDTWAGVATGGVVLIGESAVIERLHRKPPPALPRPDDTETAY